MEYLLDTVKKIAVFYVLSTFLMNLINDGKYKKYINMFCGIVIIILVIKPVGHLLSMDKSFADLFDFNEISGMSADLRENLKLAGDRMSKELINEFKDKAAKELEKKFLEYNLYIKDMDIEFELDEAAYGYGTVKNFFVYAGKTKGTNEIFIGEYDPAKDIAVIELKNYISEVYKINKNNIYVNISL